MKKNEATQGAQRLYAAGKLIGCFGIKGLLKLQPVTRDPERFSKLRSAYVGPSAESAVSFEIESIELKGKGLVVKFASIDDRTAAEGLAGKYLFVDEKQRVRPARGSYFVDDVIGCEIQGADGKIIGVVTEIYQLSGHDLWEVHTGSAKAMIPAVKEFIRNVDVERRIITVDLPEGLIESSGAAGSEAASGDAVGGDGVPKE